MHADSEDKDTEELSKERRCHQAEACFCTESCHPQKPSKPNKIKFHYGGSRVLNDLLPVSVLKVVYIFDFKITSVLQ